jgi:hypothetical protein
MRITKVAGLAIAGATVVGGLALGGVAYANSADDGGNGESVVQIYSNDDGQSSSTTDRDCPEKDGGTTPETNL